MISARLLVVALVLGIAQAASAAVQTFGEAPNGATFDLTDGRLRIDRCQIIAPADVRRVVSYGGKTIDVDGDKRFEVKCGLRRPE